MLRFLFKISKKTHKVLGLFIILFLIWSSISGIILNHKELFASFTIPSSMVPDQYSHNNWNRGSMIDFLFLKDNPKTGFVGGKKGVFKTIDGGKSFKPFMKDYPKSLLFKKTNDLLLIEDSQLLFAGNNRGLYFCNINDGEWKKLLLDKNNITKVMKIIHSYNKLIIITDSDVFTTSIARHKLGDTFKVASGDTYSAKAKYFEFTNLHINRSDNEKINLIDYFRHIHSGNVWGLFGRLLFDILGLLIIFFSISAFYIWYFPRKKNKTSKGKKNYGFFLKYHKRLGIFTAFFILVIAITAFFMRPPFVAIIANTKISSSLYPAFGTPKPWAEKLHNAVYMEKSNKLIIETTEGFYEGHLKKKAIFKKIDAPLNVFVMGATVFEKLNNDFLIGSFNGLYKVTENGEIIDYINKNKPQLVSSIIPGKYMITGYFKTHENEEFITTHREGILYLNGKSAKERFPMPVEISENNSMSLWNYMFELHNGRIFKDIIGKLYILIIPLFSLLLFLVTISGVFDWIIRKFKN